MIINSKVSCFKDLYLYSLKFHKFIRLFSFPINKNAYSLRIKLATDYFNDCFKFIYYGVV